VQEPETVLKEGCRIGVETNAYAPGITRRAILSMRERCSRCARSRWVGQGFANAQALCWRESHHEWMHTCNLTRF